jgi:hypothetical protein
MDPNSVVDLTAFDDERPDLEILRLHFLVISELKFIFQLRFTRAFFGR